MGTVSVKGLTQSLNPEADAKSKPPDDAKSNLFLFQRNKELEVPNYRDMFMIKSYGPGLVIQEV